jgi:hypothetical protein
VPQPAPALHADSDALAAWLAAPNCRHPEYTNAEALGVDDELFGPGHDGFLSTVEDVWVADPDGLTNHTPKGPA